MTQREVTWLAAHLIAFAMLFVGGWVTVAGFLLMVFMPRYSARSGGTEHG
jgi:hypothetical protein